MKNDNPYEWSFEEYKAWHDGVVKKATRSDKDSYAHYDIREHSVVEMANIGLEKWGEKSYRIAVSDDLNSKRTPLIAIYDAHEANLVHPQFMFGISLLDILTKDEINLVLQIDRSNDIFRSKGMDCSWIGYDEIYNGFKSFLFSKPNTRKSEDFMDNLDRAIHEWNREADIIGYEQSWMNPLKNYIEGRDLEVLPKYRKYFEN